MAPRKRTEELRSLGLTPTIQRVAVLKYLESTKSHPTADDVLAAIRKEYPSVSRATVYNTLEALTKAGAILKLSVDTPAAHYDADLAPHGHFQCRVCGRLEDIALTDTSCLQQKVRGHRVETVRTYAFGVCASCVKGAREPAATSPRRREPAGRKTDGKEKGDAP